MNLKGIFGYDVAEAIRDKESQSTEAEISEKKSSQPKKPESPQSEKPAQSNRCPVTVIDREEAFSDTEVDLSDASTIRELMRAEDCYNDWLDRGDALVRIGKNHFPDEKSLVSADFYYWTRLLSTVLDSAPATIFTDEVLAAIAKNSEKSTTTPTKTTAYPKITSVSDAPAEEYQGKHSKI